MLPAEPEIKLTLRLIIIGGWSFVVTITIKTTKEIIMTYFEAIGIKQDLIVNMQYAFNQTPAEALKETAKNYSNEQLAEAYKVICAKLNEEKRDLKELFILAVKSKSLPDKNETDDKQ